MTEVNKKAKDYAKSYHEYGSRIASEFSYIAGYESAIDECKSIVNDFQAATVEVLLEKLEALKSKQP